MVAPRPLRYLLAACAAWLLALGWLGFEQTRVWRDSYSLWTAAIDADPECALCHGNLAAYLVNNHDAGGGIRHAQIALDLRPDRPRPYATLGQGLLKAGKPAEAVPYFEEFLRRLPSSTDVLISLGVALMRADRPRDAVVPLQRAVALTPDKPLARVNYAAALVQLRDREGAMAQYFAALALDPMSPEARYGLGWALVQFGELDAARRDYVVLKSLDARLATRLASDIAGATRTP